MLAVLAAVVRKELLTQLRDSTVLVFSVGFPLVFCPAAMWAVFTLLSLEEGLRELRPPRVAVIAPYPGLEALTEPPVEAVTVDPDGVVEALADGDADVVVIAEADGPALTLSLHHLSTRPRSRAALELVQERVAPIADLRRATLAAALGLGPEALDPRAVRTVNVDSTEEVTVQVASIVLPMLVVYLMVLGAYYPVVELVIGERERGSLETSLVSAAPRGVLIAGKLIAVMAVATFSVFGGVLAAAITVGHLMVTLAESLDGRLVEALQRLDFSFAAEGVVLSTAALLSLLPAVVGLLTLTALPGRTYKEALNFSSLTMVGVMVVMMAPLLEPTLTVWLAAVPLLGAILVSTEALDGGATAAQTLLAVGVNLALAALCLGACARVLASERYLLGDWAPRWTRWLSPGGPE